VNESEKLWKQYESHIGLYKFYIEAVIKLNVFNFAISGAIASFFFANTGKPNIHLSLLLPALTSLSLAALFAWAAFSNLVTRKDVFNIRDKLGLRVAPEFLVLSVILWVFCFANLITGIGAIYYLWPDCN